MPRWRAWLRLPPRWVRRVVVGPALVVLALLWLPVAVWWVVLAAMAVSFAFPGKLRVVRVLWLMGFYLLWDVVALLALLGLWVGSGFGWKLKTRRFQRAHYAVAGTMLKALFSQVTWTLRLEIDVDETSVDRQTLREGPIIVVSRHAGPGDSFIIVDALLNTYRREPAIVLKDTLQWDPALDVLMNRIPTRFVTPRAFRKPGTGGGADAVAQLALEMGTRGALLIFPEGANSTPGRRAKRIRALKESGLHDRAARAEALAHVMTPHAGGVLAAMEARPDARVVMVAHTGLEELSTVGDVWKELPLDKRISLHGWAVDPADIPEGRQAREEWLDAWWETIDSWIAHHPTRASAAATKAGDRSRTLSA
jgi:1-acyl-sn-glycerol-3-phosphate acyltransferase